jgi:hypothetical protein
MKSFGDSPARDGETRARPVSQGLLMAEEGRAADVTS